MLILQECQKSNKNWLLSHWLEMVG